MEKSWIAQIEKTIQVSEDQWRVTRMTLKLEKLTTVQEIQEWVKSKGVGSAMVELLEVETLVSKTPNPTQ